MAQITVIGGSGFVGRHLVRKLAQDGHRVTVGVRRPVEAYYLKPMGRPGQINIVQANIRNQPSIAKICQGADVVINLVGILYETSKQKFDGVHVMGAKIAATCAKEAGVKRFVQMSSALGASEASESSFAQSRIAGDKAVQEIFEDATIIRPAVLFGPEDGFFNRFAGMARMAPVLPLFGGGQNKFQPVYVGDVAAAFAYAATHDETAGQTYEIAGPRVYTMKEIYDFVLEETARKRFVVPVPIAPFKPLAAVLSLLPRPLITPDQLEQLKTDNLPSGNYPGLDALGVEQPATVDAIVPEYLWRFRAHGEFEASII